MFGKKGADSWTLKYGQGGAPLSLIAEYSNNMSSSLQQKQSQSSWLVGCSLEVAWLTFSQPFSCGLTSALVFTFKIFLIGKCKLCVFMGYDIRKHAPVVAELS